MSALCEGNDGVACNLVDNQPLCEELQCVWLGTCQSSVKSLCKNQREERLCQQVWGCTWRGATPKPTTVSGNVPVAPSPRPLLPSATTAALLTRTPTMVVPLGDSNGGIIAGAVVSRRGLVAPLALWWTRVFNCFFFFLFSRSAPCFSWCVWLPASSRLCASASRPTSVPASRPAPSAVHRPRSASCRRPKTPNSTCRPRRLWSRQSFSEQTSVGERVAPKSNNAGIFSRLLPAAGGGAVA